MAACSQVVVWNPVFGYVPGLAASSSRRKAWPCDLYRTVATGPDAEILDRLVCYTGGADSFVRWKVNHA
jgi:hypothetical protein